MIDNPIIDKVDHPLFIKREGWLRDQIQRALDQPFLTFQQLIRITSMGLYLIYDDDELLYIGMTTRKGNLRLGELSSSFKKHTFNRKLLAEYFRSLGHEIHVINPKSYKARLINNGIISLEDFKAAQKIVNQKIRTNLRFRFYETQAINIETIEHYAIAVLQPLYND